jgi:predicted DNA-binding transcriptional regulator AlpA
MNSATLPDYAAVGRLLNMKQIMELVNCKSRRTIQRYVERGILKPIKLGKHPQSSVRFRYDETMWSLDNLKK